MGREQAQGAARAGRDHGRSWGRLLLELVVIFVGVLGAFFAEDARQQLDDERRARQIYAALHGELEAFLQRVPLVVEEIGTRSDAWSAAYDAGERPPLAYYREPGAEAPPTAIWEATLASGGVALLDPELFNALARYYNRLGSTIDRYRRYNIITEEEVLPYLEGRSDVFYDDEGRLRGVYRTHLLLLEEIREELIALSTEGGAVAAAVARAAE